MRTRLPLDHNSSTIHYFISNGNRTAPIYKRWDNHPQFRLTLPDADGMRSPGSDLLTYIGADGAIVYRAQ